MDDVLPCLTAERLAARATEAAGAGPCHRCAALVCPSWESVPAGFDDAVLKDIGTLRVPGDDAPTLGEYHPEGTRLWSINAPIAPAFHPYNLCTVQACSGCGRVFLRYTEYGGYYVDQRIRALDARLVVLDPDARVG